MLSESAANEKVLCSFQQKGIGSKVNTLCKLNPIIFALPSALTSSPGNKSLMLQLVPQPGKTSGCGMKGVESGQVLLGKFAICELSTSNCLCSHVLVSAAYLLWSAQVCILFVCFLQFSTYYFCICMCVNVRVFRLWLLVHVSHATVCVKAAGAGAQRMTACLRRSETQTL